MYRDVGPGSQSSIVYREKLPHWATCDRQKKGEKEDKKEGGVNFGQLDMGFLWILTKMILNIF